MEERWVVVLAEASPVGRTFYRRPTQSGEGMWTVMRAKATEFVTYEDAMALCGRRYDPRTGPYPLHQ